MARLMVESSARPVSPDRGVYQSKITVQFDRRSILVRIRSTVHWG